ncbi:hypothetical protein C8R45DRAFT_934666 [Mycena sanguinolenta]|nr:hypothetical protein C8R45DRAFT_934666 [Mycena sanguinolenta]
MPAPAPAVAEDEDTPPPVQSEASPASLPVNTPAVPGSVTGGPDGVASRAPQGRVEGEDAPLPLDVLTALEWAAASENTEPAPHVSSAAHDDDDLGADEDSGSGSGSGSDAGADAAAGMKQRGKKPKLLQRLKDKLHVGHVHA